MILSGFSPLLRLPLLRELTRDSLLRMNPETAHGATIAALRLGLAPTPTQPDAPELRRKPGVAPGLPCLRYPLLAGPDDPVHPVDFGHLQDPWRIIGVHRAKFDPVERLAQ